MKHPGGGFSLWRIRDTANSVLIKNHQGHETALCLQPRHSSAEARSPEKLWDALTNPEVTSKYWHGAFNHSDWSPGARWTSKSEDGEVYLDGEILESDRPRRLVHTFHVVHQEDAAGERPSRVTWEIEPDGSVCRLRMIHDDFYGETETFGYVGEGGWSWVLSGLKTYLETDQALASLPAARTPAA